MSFYRFGFTNVVYISVCRMGFRFLTMSIRACSIVQLFLKCGEIEQNISCSNCMEVKFEIGDIKVYVFLISKSWFVLGRFKPIFLWLSIDWKLILWYNLENEIQLSKKKDTELMDFSFKKKRRWKPSKIGAMWIPSR